jgi:threonine dehydratase
MSQEQESTDRLDVSSAEGGDAPAPPTTADVVRAAETVHRHLPETPLVRSEYLSAELDADVFLKREDVLPTGAFKVRGGVNFVHGLDADHEGVVTASTGNHGQSLAYAGREFDVPVTIVMPEEANPGKVAAIRRLGAHVEAHSNDVSGACRRARSLADEEDRRFVHPANEPELVAGVGTAGLEVVEQCPGIDYVFCPIGGGSSASGYCLTVGTIPDADVVGVQVAGADPVYRAWHQGGMEALDCVDTFAEGLAVGTPFELTVSVLREELSDVLRVDDESLRRVIHDMLDEEGVLVEGAAAAGIAGALECRDCLAGSTIVVPISGRNLSTVKLRGVLDDFE